MLRLLPALAEDIDAHVVLGEDGPLVPLLLGAGIRTEIMPLPPRVRDLRKADVRLGSLNLGALSGVAGYVLSLSRRIRSLEADLVHTNSLKSALYGGTAARVARTPAVWHIRDRVASDYLPRSAVALVHALSRVIPAAVIANSAATLRTLPSLARARIVFDPAPGYAPVGLPPPSLRQPGETVIGLVGRLAPWKGQSVFLDAFASAFKGTSVKGRIIGSSMFGEEAYAVSLQQQVEQLGISDQIEFRGFRDDVWQELNQLDVLVHCSIMPEPFGQVILEGMAAGVPVIAAAAGGPTEIITDGVDGILTSPGNAEELAAALRLLDGDPSQRAKLATAGRQRSQDFAPEQSARAMLEVYRDVLGHQGWLAF